ncbi:MAG: hypothetical protein WD398_04000 [Cyclobacteriaceae bacterium]
MVNSIFPQRWWMVSGSIWMINIKEKSPYGSTFVAGYTKGYIYYAPTAEQLRNKGAAQEDSETVLAPEWQDLFEN